MISCVLYIIMVPLYKGMIFLNRVLYDLLAVNIDLLAVFFFHFIHIYRGAVLQNNVCFSDIWQMSLENINGVIQCNRYDRTSALFCNFKGTGMEWKKT